MKTVLIVDDDPFIVDLLSRQLQKKGFNVISSTDPETAYSMAEEKRPDLIMSDIAMPALDGLTLLKALKQNKVTQGIPLVLLTGSDRMADVEEAYNSGAEAYLIKPFDWEAAWPKLEPFLKG